MSLSLLIKKKDTYTHDQALLGKQYTQQQLAYNHSVYTGSHSIIQCMSLSLLIKNKPNRVKSSPKIVLGPAQVI